MLPTHVECGAGEVAGAAVKVSTWEISGKEGVREVHAPQEMARILGETVDYARQAQLAAERAAKAK